jgi:Na+-translocating ferredoxin:NAD+ oxidoreductase RnfA subunit
MSAGSLKGAAMSFLIVGILSMAFMAFSRPFSRA